MAKKYSKETDTYNLLFLLYIYYIYDVLVIYLLEHLL